MPTARTAPILRRFLLLALAPFAACATNEPTSTAPAHAAAEAPAASGVGDGAKSSNGAAANTTKAAAVAATTNGPRAQASIDADLARVLELAKRDNRVQEHLRYLTKQIGPRLTGSNHFNRAAEWCVGQFRAWGLDARLEKWGEFPAGFDRGPCTGRIVAPDQQDLVFIAPAWSPGTAGPVRGPALLEPKELADVDAIKPKLKGAWLVRREKRPDGKTRKAIDEACIAEGLAGYVSGARGDLLVMGGNETIKLAELPKQSRVTLRNDQYKALVERLDKNESVELEFDLQHQFTPGPVPCFNVVADLRGTEFPDEYVVVGGHLDSWDAAEGAQDNGTGTSTTLEAARLIASSGAKPRRTIRFLLFGGEEEGLFGSEFYVKQHKDELAKTSIALVHDGGGTALRGISPTYTMFADFERVFAPFTRAGEAFPFTVHEVDALTNSGDSDHAPFISAGVPGFFWEQSEEGYDHVHHTQYDTFESVDPAQQEHSARVVAVAALAFADLDHLVDRTDTSPIPRRRMGVQLEGTRLTSVSEKGKAEEAGLQVGDVVLSIDGADVKTQNEVTAELQRGSSRKLVRVKRGDQEMDVTLDYTGMDGENERVERAKRKAEWMKTHPAPAH